MPDPVNAEYQRQDRPTKRWLVLLVVAAVVAIVIVVAVRQRGGNAGAPAVALATASIRSFPVTATATGTVVPASEIGLNFTTSAQLIEIDAKVGDHVAKGAVLAKIDPAGAQASVNAAQAALAASRTPTEAAQARGSLAKAQVDLAATSLLAPADGKIQAINGQVGEIVSANATATQTLPGTSAQVPQVVGAGASATPGPTPFIELVANDNVVVGAAFAAADAPQVQAGQKCQITSEVITGLSLPCHVIGRAGDATVIDGLPRFYVSAAPDGTDPRLLPGMPVDLRVTVGQAANVVAVPNQALYLLDGQTHVDVWFKGRAVPTTVTAGQVGAELTEVKSGLSAGQQVVLSTASGLRGTPTPPTT